MAKKAKSRTIAVRLVSMALTGYYKTLVRPRTHKPLSMLKYDPVAIPMAIAPVVNTSARCPHRKDAFLHE
ncbi:hypothetical protein PZA11_000375 [Diplocarpon coronariae]